MLFSIRSTNESITAGSSSAPSSLRASIAASISSRSTVGFAMVRFCQAGTSHGRRRGCSSLTDGPPQPRHSTQRADRQSGTRARVRELRLSPRRKGRVRRRWSTGRWIACRLEFRGWHREPLMPAGKSTELFFLDEATAFAAGHRPCALCRREDYVRFGELWGEVHPGAVGADAIDAQLHTERVDGRTQRLHEAPIGGLPDGAFVLVEHEPWLVLDGGLRRWTPAGYEGRRPLPARGLVITPPSLVESAPERVGRRRAAPAPVGHAGRVTASLPRKTIPSWLSVRSPVSLSTKLHVTCPVAPSNCPVPRTT